MELEQNPHGFGSVPPGAYVCNVSRPMPANRDMLGHRWWHVNAEKVGHTENGVQQWYCKNCNHRWNTNAFGHKTSVDDTLVLHKPVRLSPLEEVDGDENEPAEFRLIYSDMAQAHAMRRWLRSIPPEGVKIPVEPAPVKVPKPTSITTGHGQRGYDAYTVTYGFRTAEHRGEFMRSIRRAPVECTVHIGDSMQVQPRGPGDAVAFAWPGDETVLVTYQTRAAASLAAQRMFSQAVSPAKKPTDAQVERVTMALLGKTEDPSPGVNWVVTRHDRVNTWRAKVREALEAVWQER